MTNSDWNNLRAKLHHDWLQNRYLTFLKSWKNCFDDTEVCGIDRADVLEQLLQWKNKKGSFEILINECTGALSPRQLLCEPPLDSMSKENMEWVGDVIHALYCARVGIKDKIANLNSLIKDIDTVVDDKEQVLKSGRHRKRTKSVDIVTLFMEFSRKISELPHDIQVV